MVRIIHTTYKKKEMELSIPLNLSHIYRKSKTRKRNRIVLKYNPTCFDFHWIEHENRFIYRVNNDQIALIVSMDGSGFIIQHTNHLFPIHYKPCPHPLMQAAFSSLSEKERQFIALWGKFSLDKIEVSKAFPGYNDPFTGIVAKTSFLQDLVFVVYEDGDCETITRSDAIDIIVFETNKQDPLGLPCPKIHDNNILLDECMKKMDNKSLKYLKQFDYI